MSNVWQPESNTQSKAWECKDLKQHLCHTVGTLIHIFYVGVYFLVHDQNTIFGQVRNLMERSWAHRWARYEDVCVAVLVVSSVAEHEPMRCRVPREGRGGWICSVSDCGCPWRCSGDAEPSTLTFSLQLPFQGLFCEPLRARPLQAASQR